MEQNWMKISKVSRNSPGRSYHSVCLKITATIFSTSSSSTLFHQTNENVNWPAEAALFAARFVATKLESPWVFETREA